MRLHKLYPLNAELPPKSAIQLCRLVGLGCTNPRGWLLQVGQSCQKFIASDCFHDLTVAQTYRMNATIIDTVNATLLELTRLYQVGYNYVPGASVIVRYIQKSYQNDPFRIVLELLLVVFAFKYLFSKTYRPDTNEVKLSQKVDDGSRY
jgi:hypothetical protein